MLCKSSLCYFLPLVFIGSEGRKDQCLSPLFWWVGPYSTSLLCGQHPPRSILQDIQRTHGKRAVIGFCIAQGAIMNRSNITLNQLVFYKKEVYKNSCFSVQLLSTKVGIYSLHTFHCTLNTVSYPSEHKLDIIGCLV